MKTQRPPQFLRLIAGEIGHDHRDLEHLFLKQRNAERAFEDRLQSFIEVSDRLFPGATIQIRMHHVALDRPWPDDRDFNHDIVKTFRLHPRQRRHLRAALDLKNADRVGVLHDLERFLVVFWNVSEIERPPAFAAKLERVLHHRHHPQA